MPNPNPTMEEAASAIGALVKAARANSPEPAPAPTTPAPSEKFGPEEPRVDVITKDGQLGTIPASQVQAAVFQKKAFTLAPDSPVKSTDFDQDGRLKVVTKDGQAGTINRPTDLQELSTALKKGQWTLQSEYDRKNNPEYKKNKELVGDSGFDYGLNDKLKKSGFSNATVVNADHQYLMIDPKSGIKVNVPYDDLKQARQAGFQFQDPSFENVYQVMIDKAKNHPQGFDQFGQFAHSAVREMPIYSTIANQLTKHLEVSQSAEPIALLQATVSQGEEEYQSAQKAGEIVGFGFFFIVIITVLRAFLKQKESFSHKIY